MGAERDTVEEDGYGGDEMGWGGRVRRHGVGTDG